MTSKELDAYWDFLIDNMVCTEEEIKLVTSINGYREDVLNDILYVRTGYRSLDQYCDANDIENPLEDGARHVVKESAFTDACKAQFKKVYPERFIRILSCDPVDDKNVCVIGAVLADGDAYYFIVGKNSVSHSFGSKKKALASLKESKGVKSVTNKILEGADISTVIGMAEAGSTILRDRGITSTDDVDELVLYISNDGDLYRRQTTPIIDNLKKKYKKGNYDPELAVKAFMYLVDAGVRKYDKEFGSGLGKLFLDKNTRTEIAKELRDRYEDEITEE